MYEGIHIQGLGRGTLLGFPTINLHCENIKEEGVFVGILQSDFFEKKEEKALIHIGTRPTFGLIEKVVEVHLLEEVCEISFGRSYAFDLLKKIRDVQKFSSSEDLIAQIKKDKQVAESFFEK